MKPNRTLQQLLALFLSFLLVAGIAPVPALAQNAWGGTGVAEVQKDPAPQENPGLCAMGNNLVLQDGGDDGLTKVYYADASGNIVGEPIDLSTLGLEMAGDAEGGFDLGDKKLMATYSGTFDQNKDAFLDLDVVIWMEGGTLSEIVAGTSNARAKSFTVYMSGGTLTGEVSAIMANGAYLSGGTVAGSLDAWIPIYLSGSPSIGGEDCGIMVNENEKFYLNGALNGANVSVVPQDDFADGTVIAESSDGYTIAESDLSQLSLTGDYAEGKELYLEENQVKIRAAQSQPPAVAYDIWVGGTQVTEQNADDVLGNGCVRYEPQSNTLTLDGLNLSDQGYETTIQGDSVFAAIYSSDDLNIVLAEGSVNTITTTEAITASSVFGVIGNREGGSANLHFYGEGSLSIQQTVSDQTQYAAGISGGEVSVTDVNLQCTMSGGTDTVGVGADSLQIQDAEVTCTGMAYGLLGTTSLSVSGDVQIKASGNIHALYLKQGTIAMDSAYTFLGSAAENDFEHLSQAQVSSSGQGITVGSEIAKTVEINGRQVIYYVGENGQETLLTDPFTTLDSSCTVWTDGWYVAEGDVVIYDRVPVRGNVKLILKDGATLTIYGGILVTSGNQFTVYAQTQGTGVLNALSENGAGIGGGGPDSPGDNFGTIRIHGGVITATSSFNGAGIGDGLWGKATGQIWITGGVVTASGTSQEGISGILSTGDGGNATIFAESISQQETSGWRGLIFEGGEGKIYGPSFTIPAQQTIILEKDQTMIREQGVSLINNGTIRVNMGGEYIGEQPQGNRVEYQIQWDTDGDGAVDETAYLPYGETPSHSDGVKAADDQYTYTFDTWQPALGKTSAPVLYKAEFIPFVRSYQVSLPDGEGYTVKAQNTTIAYGDEFEFTVEIQDGYSQTSRFAVYANGTKLSCGSDGKYKVTITGETKITVTGVADQTAPSNLTVSYEGGFFREFWNSITFGLFFRDTVTVTLSATDEGSGVKEFTYQLGDGAPQTVPAQNGMARFTIEPEFKGNLRAVTAVDNAGNASVGIDYESFAVEKQPPTQGTVDTNGYDGDWTSENVTITVSGATATSGVARYEYSADGGISWHPMTIVEKTDATREEPLNVTKAALVVTESGQASYCFRAVSNAGNVSAVSGPVEVKIDAESPGIWITGNLEDYLQQDIIQIIPIVGFSGISKVEVQKEDGNWEKLEPSEMNQFLYEYEVTKNGTYTFRVTSGAGVSYIDSITYHKIDRVQPQVRIYSGDYTSGAWTNQDVVLRVSNTAPNLGTTTFQYQVNGGTWQDYTDAITLSQETEGTVYTFRAVSESGVVSDEQAITVNIDRTKPVLTGVTPEEVYYTTQKVVVSDAHLQSVTLNNRPVAESISLAGNTEAVYTIVAIDLAGNETRYTVTMHPIQTLAAPIRGLVAGNVTSDHKAALESVAAAVQAVDLDDATDDEKAALQQIQDQCSALLDIVQKTAAAIKQVVREANSYSAETVTKADKQPIRQLLQQVRQLIDSGNLTNQEIKNMEAVALRLEELLDQIESLDQDDDDSNEQVIWENKNPQTSQPENAGQQNSGNAGQQNGGNVSGSGNAPGPGSSGSAGDTSQNASQREEVENRINALPDRVQPDDLEAEALINAVKEQYDALTEQEKAQLSQACKNKLETLLQDLVDYQIIQGNDSQWTAGTDGSISMTANGAVEKFLGIEVDAVPVDAENYTVTSGSTVITLQPAYLETLSAGTHTLTVRYSDGETSGTFEILPKAQSAAVEEDRSSGAIIGWAALLIGLAVAIVAILGFRRHKSTTD